MDVLRHAHEFVPDVQHLVMQPTAITVVMIRAALHAREVVTCIATNFFFSPPINYDEKEFVINGNTIRPMGRWCS